MKDLKIASLLGDTKKQLIKYSPDILIGVGIAGLIGTTILAVSATPKALQLIENKKLEKKKTSKDNKEVTLTTKDVIFATWKCYIPAGIMCVMSTSCILGAVSVNARRSAVMTAAYYMTEQSLREYQSKVVETIGENKHKIIKDKIAKDKIDDAPVQSREIIFTSHGETLCYDSPSGRYFKSDIEKIKKIVNELNRQLLNEMYISQNDFYYELELSNTSLGDDLGWNLDDGLIDIDFSSQLATNGTPCLVLNYEVAPRDNY